MPGRQDADHAVALAIFRDHRDPGLQGSLRIGEAHALSTQQDLPLRRFRAAAMQTLQQFRPSGPHQTGNPQHFAPAKHEVYAVEALAMRFGKAQIPRFAKALGLALIALRTGSPLRRTSGTRATRR